MAIDKENKINKIQYRSLIMSADYKDNEYVRSYGDCGTDKVNCNIGEGKACNICPSNPFRAPDAKEQPVQVPFWNSLHQIISI